MAGLSPNRQDIIVDAYLQRLFGHAWHIRHHDQAIARLIDIDWWRHITFLMACTLRRLRRLNISGRHGLLCHGWCPPLRTRSAFSLSLPAQRSVEVWPVLPSGG